MHKSHYFPSVLFILLVLLAPAATAQITISTARQTVTDTNLIPAKADPGSPATGEFWLSTTDANRLKFRSGGSNYSIATLTDVATGYQPLDATLTSISQLKGATTRAFTFSSSGDTSGIIYFLGSTYLTGTFANPHSSIVTNVRSSNAGASTAADLTDRATNVSYTNNVANSWAAIDLGSGRTLIPTYYSLRNSGTAGGTYPRNWKLQGSNNVATNDVTGINAATWADLDTRTSDTTIASDNAWGSFAVSGITTGYRWLRILQTGLTSTGDNYLMVAEFEFYGTLGYTGATPSGLFYYDLTTDSVRTIVTSANVISLLGAADYAAMRSLLSLVPGTNVQAYSANLVTFAGIAPTANVQSLLAAADYAAFRTLLGLVIGTNVQAYSANLTTFAGIAPTANVQTLLGAADFSAFRTSLGLGSLAVLNTVGTTQIDADAVTFAKIQNVTSDRLLGRDTASSGDTEEITVAGGLEFTGTGGIQRSALTGDATASAGSNTTTVVSASTSAAGKVELATSAEALAGTSTTLVPPVSAMEARVLNGDLSRANSPSVFSDGATSNRRTEATFGTPGTVPAMAISIPFEFDVPTSNPSATGWIIVYSSTATSGDFANAADTLSGYFTTSGELVFRQNDTSSPTLNFRRLGWTGFRSAYSGLRVRGVIVFDSPNTTTNPKIYIQGVDMTASFSLNAAGTPPNWMPTALATTKFLSGYTWTSGRFVAHAPILGALSATDVLEWTQTGRLPTWCEVGTGSAVNKLSGDAYNFAGGVGGWSKLGAGTITADAGNSELDVTFTTSNEYATTPVTTGFFKAGRRYRMTVVIRNWTGTGSLRFQLGSSNQVVADITADGTYTYDITSSGAGTSMLFYRITAAALSFSIYQPTFVELAPLAKWEIQPVDSSLGGVIARDTGENNIHLVGTPGVIPITNSNRGVISATLTWSATHEAKSIAGQASLPSNARVDYITTKATVASTGAGLTVGSTTTPALFVAANSYTTSKEDHTLAARLPAGTASNDLNLVVDPDDANYTGSITVTIGYTTTISTP